MKNLFFFITLVALTISCTPAARLVGSQTKLVDGKKVREDIVARGQKYFILQYDEKGSLISESEVNDSSGADTSVKVLSESTTIQGEYTITCKTIQFGNTIRTSCYTYKNGVLISTTGTN